jgi:uncharacterized membrane protein (UPF0127 family)
MCGCNFDLDIAFMDKEGNVKEIQHMAQLKPDESPKIYRCKEGADLALELPSGWCAINDIKPGSKLKVKELS